MPVAKGNGYGFGLDVLARQSGVLGLPVLAVGIAQEVAKVRAGGWAGGFSGDLVVLNPWRPFDDVATAQLADPHVIVTVSRAEDVTALAAAHPGTRVLLEIETSMHRHGLTPGDVDVAALDRLTFEGWTIHLPADGSLADAHRLAAGGLAVRTGPIWVSHLSVADYRALSARLDVPTHMRIGTRLWLGDREAYRTTATVLDVHRIAKGDRLGYHQATAPKDGHILIVSGGTAHGVAMAAPSRSGR
ncbi:alanine racemase [Tessaracoccus sp. HDW20]|uniref:alanine racemase n=1 Tax=Tessaracoccus coleopterorum TaxID=2714950 RepID=UPI0018D2C734|nr:alanine racemase [Tessaracoccus coleopterorum]